jgi:hypothetical protein
LAALYEPYRLDAMDDAVVDPADSDDSDAALCGEVGEPRPE